MSTIWFILWWRKKSGKNILTKVIYSRAYAKIIVSLLLWSTWGIIIKLLAIPVQQVIFFSSLFSLPALYLVAGRQAWARGNLLPDLKKNFWLIFLLACCLLANLFLYFSAIRQTIIANAVFSHYTAPIFVAMMAPIFLGEIFDRWTSIALFLSLMGLFFLLFPDLHLTLTRKELFGISYGVASGVAYAATLIVAKFLTRKLSAVSIAFWQGVFIVVLLLPANLFRSINLSWFDWLTMVILGVVHSCWAPLMYVSGLKRIKAQYVAIIGYLEPVSTVIMGIFILKEIPASVTIFGGFLILFSGFLVIWKGNNLSHAE